jgi:type III secretory pathway component EscR
MPKTVSHAVSNKMLMKQLTFNKSFKLPEQYRRQSTILQPYRTYEKMNTEKKVKNWFIAIRIKTFFVINLNLYWF